MNARVGDIGILVQIRDVPEPVHRTLKARAAASGKSFTEFLRDLLDREAGRPTVEELSARIRAREPVHLDEPSDVTIRRIRGPLGPYRDGD